MNSRYGPSNKYPTMRRLEDDSFSTPLSSSEYLYSVFIYLSIYRSRPSMLDWQSHICGYLCKSNTRFHVDSISLIGARPHVCIKRHAEIQPCPVWNSSYLDTHHHCRHRLSRSAYTHIYRYDNATTPRFLCCSYLCPSDRANMVMINCLLLRPSIVGAVGIDFVKHTCLSVSLWRTHPVCQSVSHVSITLTLDNNQYILRHILS